MYMCVSGVDFSSVPTNFPLDLGTVPKVLYMFCFCFSFYHETNLLL